MFPACHDHLMTFVLKIYVRKLTPERPMSPVWIVRPEFTD